MEKPGAKGRKWRHPGGQSFSRQLDAESRLTSRWFAFFGIRRKTCADETRALALTNRPNVFVWKEFGSPSLTLFELFAGSRGAGWGGCSRISVRVGAAETGATCTLAHVIRLRSALDRSEVLHRHAPRRPHSSPSCPPIAIWQGLLSMLSIRNYTDPKRRTSSSAEPVSGGP